MLTNPANGWLTPKLTAVNVANTLPAVNDTAVIFCVAAAKLLAVIVVVNAPCTVAVLVVKAASHVTLPPDAICAKLGCPPAA